MVILEFDLQEALISAVSFVMLSTIDVALLKCVVGTDFPGNGIIITILGFGQTAIILVCAHSYFRRRDAGWLSGLLLGLTFALAYLAIMIIGNWLSVHIISEGAIWVAGDTAFLIFMIFIVACFGGYIQWHRSLP